MMKNTEINRNTSTVPHRGRLRRLLSGFLAVSTAAAMVLGSVSTAAAGELAGDYSLAGAGSGQDVTVHFGDSDDKIFNIHVSPEPDEESAAFAEEENAGVKTLEAGDLVTISAADGSDLPEEAEADAAIIKGEESIAAVEEKISEEGSSEISVETSPVFADSIGIAQTQYQVFDISLDHVDEQDYEDGFLVNVNLPENIQGGRDFHLYHLHAGEEPEEIDLTTIGSVDKRTGLETVSGFEFVTEGFSEFVLQYTVDFYYDVNGQALEYHIAGGFVESLRNLLKILSIVADDPDTDSDEVEVFMNNIENVTFSDESLVKPVCVTQDTTAGAIVDALNTEIEYSAELTEDDIARIRAAAFTAPDWALVSLKPFLSDETLTITMKSGDVVTIIVKDAQDPSGYVGKKVIIYDNSEQRAMTAENWGWDGYRYRFSSIDVSTADSDTKAQWTIEYANGSYYLKSYDGKYLYMDQNKVSLVDSQSSATQLSIQAGSNPDYYIAAKSDSDSVLTYCLNGNYDGFFSAPNGAYGDVKKWLYIREAAGTTQSANYFSVDVATWTSWGQRWGKLNSKYIGQNGTSGIDGDRYPASGTAAGRLQDDGTTRFQYGVGAVPNTGYEFAFWAYQENGQYRQLSSITNSTIIPNNPTEYYAYFTQKGTKLFIYQSENTSMGTVDKSYGYSTDTGATATANYGYKFKGWFDTDGQLISLNPTFSVDDAPKSMVLTAKFFRPQSANIYVSVNDPTGGDVVVTENGQETSYCGTRTTRSDGLLDKTITAKPKDGYTFCYWTLNGDRMNLDSNVLGPDSDKGATPYFEAGDQLQAVFMKSTLIDANGNANSDIHVGTEKKEQFERWLESLEKNQPLSANKTAKVYEHDGQNEYDNRIYQVDIEAESARVDATANIGMAFILDASNSMQFPANIVRTGKELVLTQANLNKAFPEENGPLYFISDPTRTSTMYRLYKEDGYWYAVDASYSDADKIREKRYLVDWNYYYSDSDNKGNVPLAYPIYRDTSELKRVDYLNTGLNDTIDTMRSIVNKVNKTDYDIKVAYTMFAAYTYRQHEEGFTPPAGFQWVDFTSLKDPSLNVNLGDTDGGTRQDLGLNDALSFNWSSIPEGQRYAILITDGAAVISGSGTTWDGKTYQGVQDNIVAQAQALKNMGVKLITVGLSTRNVVGGSNVLKNIASDNLFFEAESGDDLQNILYEILQTVVKNGTSCGQISDEVDEAFYPVLADGTPIPRGTSYYKADGTQIDKQTYDSLAPWNSRYKWEETNGKWKITWENQYIGWDPTDSDSRKQPWKGTFYVKAKENFLGGNTISTNDSCKVVEDGYTFDETLTTDISHWTLHSSSKPTVDLPSPYVNVDELQLTQNSTEWTVYLDTEIDPLAQLKDLYSKIDVLKVVSNSTDEMLTNKNQMLGGKDEARSERFTLASVVGSLTDAEWNSLIAGGTVSKQYTHYSHEHVGDIQVQLIKQQTAEGEQGLNPSPHQTSVIGDGVEQYTFKVTYVPVAEQDPAGGWHTTTGGSRGDTTAQMDSENSHKVNVFVDEVQIRKTDSNGDLITSKIAKFKLYRKANDGETAVELKVGNEKVSVVQTGDEITTESGLANVRLCPYSPTYYLVETEAPEGYAKRETPIVIRMNRSDSFWKWNDEQKATVITTLKDDFKPHNWIQTVTVTSDEEGLITSGDAGSNAHIHTYRLNVENPECVNIRIEKINENTRSAVTPSSLTGAQFKLMKWDGVVLADNEEVEFAEFSDEYSFNGGIFVDADGKLQFEGLSDGEYQIVETTVPEGFIKVDNKIYFTLQGGVVSRHSVPAFKNGTVAWDYDYGTGEENEVDCVTYKKATGTQDAIFTVGNTPAAVLPATGGEGINLIYLIGLMLTALALAGLMMRRKRRAA